MPYDPPKEGTRMPDETLFFDPNAPWVLPEKLPDWLGGGSTPTQPDIPPGGDEPLYGQPCELYNMEPLPAGDPEVAIMEAASGLKHTPGKFPFCRPKSGTPMTPTDPTEPSLPQPAQKAMKDWCEDNGYTEKKNVWVGVAAGAAGGALLGGLLGYLMGKK
jgi:hypothetical protein